VVGQAVVAMIGVRCSVPRKGVPGTPSIEEPAGKRGDRGISPEEGGKKAGEMALRVCTASHKEAIIFEEKGEKGMILCCPLCTTLEEVEELKKELANKSVCNLLTGGKS